MLRVLIASISMISLVPAIAAADSDPCAGPDNTEPVALHPSDQPMPRDGWIALDAGWGDVSDVTVVDMAGRTIEAMQVFDDQTRRSWEVLQPVEALEPGSYELHLTHQPECFGPRPEVLPLQVSDDFATPVMTAPTIEVLEAVVYGDELHLEVELAPPPATEPLGWVVVDADFSSPEGWNRDALVDPRSESSRVVLRRTVVVDELEEVCVYATAHDVAGGQGPTTEQCADPIVYEPLDNGPLTCSVGRTSSPGAAWGMLLGLLVLYRRRRAIGPGQ